MNILIPHTWLLEHLDTKATPQDIQKYLSLCGPSIERIYEREGEPVYDIEVTTNRVDSMSVRGIAREAAVILRQFNIPAKLKPLKLQEIVHKKSAEDLQLPQIIDDKKLSKRIICVALDNVQRAPTPELMAKRLRQIEVNVHDAVIDITNYVTHELGHPCHAFDYDKIMELGGTIIVTEAKAGKKFVTLDNAEYTTVGGEVVFENQDGDIIDLPGIKGTANSAINSQTKRVLFWLESIDPKKIRFGSMTHAIRTVAAQLNEKNVDPELAEEVLQYGTQLFTSTCQAKIASPVKDIFPKQKTLQSIKVPLSTISAYLGVELLPRDIANILTALECEVELGAAKSTKTRTANPTLTVTPPSFRPDLEIPADIVEEVARIYGYHNLPSVLMPTQIPLNRPKDTNFTIEHRIKNFLADIGWQEVYTYSMVSEKIAAESGHALADHLKLQNPLTDDHMYLRRSLLPSLREVLVNNSQRSDLSVFELAYTYEPKKSDLPIQLHHLSFLSKRAYQAVRGDFEALCRAFFISSMSVRELEADELYSQHAEITLTNWKNTSLIVGSIGILHTGEVAVDIDMKKFLSLCATHPQYQPQQKTNQIVEDLTFTLKEFTRVGEILITIKKQDALVQHVELVGAPYKNNFSFRVMYGDPTKNVTVDDVTPIRKQIISTLEELYGAQLVGSQT